MLFDPTTVNTVIAQCFNGSRICLESLYQHAALTMLLMPAAFPSMVIDWHHYLLTEQLRSTFTPD